MTLLANQFINKYGDLFPSMVRCFQEDLDACLTHLDFPKGFIPGIAPEEKIKEAEKLAFERCPVVFTLRNPVELVPFLEIANG